MKYFLFVWGFIFFWLLLFGILFISRVRRMETEVVSKETEVQITKIRFSQSRGGIFINDTLVIHSYSKLITGDLSTEDWSLESPPKNYVFSLGDLKVPYMLRKAKDSDTILVEKNRTIYKFLLPSNLNN